MASRRRSRHIHDIHNEPMYQNESWDIERYESKLNERIVDGPDKDTIDRSHHSIYDEPTFNPEIAGPIPEGAMTWWMIFQERRSRITYIGSWVIAMLIGLSAGPLSIPVVFYQSSLSGIGWIYLDAIVTAPIIEEICKVLILYIIVESKPWRFLSRFQIVAIGALGGLGFGIIENLVYQFIYLDNPSNALLVYRWTLCTTMHVLASSLAAFGISIAWKAAIHGKRRPKMGDGLTGWMMAIGLHAVFNILGLALWAMNIF